VRFLNAVNRFTFRHATTVRAIPWVILLGIGLWLVFRGRTGARRELGLGLFLMGAWNTPFYVLGVLGVRFQFSNPLLDIVFTLGVALVLVVRWRHIDRFEAVALMVVVVFSWLAFSRGDFITAIANGPLGFLNLSVVAVVFGIVFTLLADSAMASGSSRQFPRDSRPLLYLGFLVLSTTACTRNEARETRRETNEASRDAGRDLHEAGRELKEDSSGAAYKAGKAAHKLADETKDAARVVGRELKEAGQNAKEGWDDARHEKK